jgi:hypothetical protein
VGHLPPRRGGAALARHPHPLLPSDGVRQRAGGGGCGARPADGHRPRPPSRSAGPAAARCTRRRTRTTSWRA